MFGLSQVLSNIQAAIQQQQPSFPLIASTGGYEELRI